MRRLRTVSVLAAAATASALAFPGSSQAAVTFTPSAADFAGCPTLPSGANNLLWGCVSVVLTNGSFKLGRKLDIGIGGPVRLNVAFGFHEGKVVTLTGREGSGTPTPGGVDVPGVGGFDVKVEQAGPLVVDGLIPKAVPIKLHLIGPLLGGSCYLGTDATPIVLAPTLADVGLKTGNNTPYVAATIAEKTFNVPASTGCGLVGALLNSFLGLPSPTGSNAVSIDVALQAKSYAFGNITANLATPALRSS